MLAAAYETLGFFGRDPWWLVLPLELAEDMPDRTVWVPLNSTPGGAYRTLGTTVGHLVTIASAEEA